MRCTLPSQRKNNDVELLPDCLRTVSYTEILPQIIVWFIQLIYLSIQWASEVRPLHSDVDQ
jgi:hypothetical protein